MIPELWRSPEFWIAVAAGVLITLTDSKPSSPWRRAASALVAVFSATVCTAPVVAYLQLDVEDFQYFVAALIALTFEQAARMLLSLSLADIISIIRPGARK